MRMPLALPASLAAGLLVGVAAPASAIPVFDAPGQTHVATGTLAADDSVHVFAFSVGGSIALDMVIESFSYAGGVLRDGTTVSRGGFDTVLGLYDESGMLVAQGQDNWLRPDSGGDGNAYDDRIAVRLAPGGYTLTVSQWDNEPPALFDLLGFAMAGDPDFTSWFCPGSGTRFCDSQGASRTPDFVVELAAIPLPGALALLLTGLGALAVAGRARRR